MGKRILPVLSLLLSFLVAQAVYIAGMHESSVVLVILLGVVGASLIGNWIIAAAASVVGVLGFNFLFTEPRFTFTVNDSQYLLTFAAMLSVALTATLLISRVRQKNELLGKQTEELRHQIQVNADLARTRELEREKAAAAEKRAQREELTAAILRAVSHDIRTPLGAVLTEAESLVRLSHQGTAGRESVRSMGAVADQARLIQGDLRSLVNLVESLLSLSRLKTLQGLPDRRWELSTDIAATAVQRMDPDRRRITIHNNSSSPLIHCSPKLLEQVVCNLLDNSLAHAPADSTVDLLLSDDEGWFCLEVRDKGPGVPESQRPRVFDPGVRLDPVKSGYGFGLAFCRTVVESHGGTIDFVPSDIGAAVAVRLPVQPVPESRPPVGD